MSTGADRDPNVRDQTSPRRGVPAPDSGPETIRAAARSGQEEFWAARADTSAVAASADAQDSPDVAATQPAAQRCQDAFWAAVVRHFPSADSGDFPPCATWAFDAACATALERSDLTGHLGDDAAVEFAVACEEAVSAWVDVNLPGTVAISRMRPE